jgi:uncharacterized membrane protein YukC
MKKTLLIILAIVAGLVIVFFAFTNFANDQDGSVATLQDVYVFEDTSYTEVTITSREHWDQERLPQQVIDLENEGYVCYPLPLEFDFDDSGAVPAVTVVEWTCEGE